MTQGHGEQEQREGDKGNQWGWLHNSEREGKSERYRQKEEEGSDGERMRMTLYSESVKQKHPKPGT